MSNKAYTIGQSSNISSNIKNYYNWAIWIEEKPEVLEEIESVTYYLHKTFPDPVQARADAEDKFILETNGWGTFMIYIEIELKNGDMLKQEHYLILKENYDSTQPEVATRGMSSPTSMKPAKEKSVFISYSTTDEAIAFQLKEYLEKNKFVAVRAIDAPSGKSVNDFVKDSIEEADIMLIIESDFESPWQQKEIELAGNKQTFRITPRDKNVKTRALDDSRVFFEDLGSLLKKIE